jgi:hypothetical protein
LEWPKKIWNPPIVASDTLTIIKNGLKNEKVIAPENKRGWNLKKNKAPNTTKADSQTPKKFIVCCSVAIKVQRWFVEL